MSGFRGQRFSQQAALKVSCRLSISAEERRATADAFFGSSAEINSSSAQIWLQMAFDALCAPYPAQLPHTRPSQPLWGGNHMRRREHQRKRELGPRKCAALNGRKEK